MQAQRHFSSPRLSLGGIFRFAEASEIKIWPTSLNAKNDLI